MMSVTESHNIMKYHGVTFYDMIHNTTKFTQDIVKEWCYCHAGEELGIIMPGA